MDEMEGLSITTICLVRHGETDWNAESKLQGREDIDLNETGEDQASLTGTYLKRFHWDAILTSPLARARRTAHLINYHLTRPMPLVTLDLLIERDMGAASGMVRSEVPIRFPDGFIPGQEPWDHLTRRVTSILDHALSNYRNQRTLMVSHGATINALLSVVSNGDIGTGKTLIDNACINVLAYEGEWRIRKHNFTDHLTKPTDSLDMNSVDEQD